MLRRLTFYTLLLLLTLGLAGTHGASSGIAQDADASSPGHLDFGTIDGWFDQAPHLEMTLQGRLLDLAAAATENANADVPPLLNRIESIRLRGYSLDAAPDFDADLDAFQESLVADGWSSTAHLRDDAEQLHLFLHESDDAINGLTVVLATSADDRALFVNIVGAITPDDLSALSNDLEIDVLDEVDEAID